MKIHFDLYCLYFIHFIVFAMDQEVQTFICSYCPYRTRDQNSLLTHYSLSHEFKPNFSITCSEPHCQTSFKKVRYLRAHKRKFHQLIANDNLEIDNELVNCVNDDNAMRDNPDCNREDIEYDPKKTVAISVISLREQKKVPLKLCQTFLDFTSAVVESDEKYVCSRLKNVLRDENIPHETKKRILSSVYQHDSEVKSTILDFSKRDALDRYAQKNLHFVSPETYLLGRTGIDNMQYISILETLKALLNKDDVFAQVMNPHVSHDGKIRDICHGSYFKNHPFWQSDPNMLQIMLYFDEFTAINQSGCHSARYKFGGFYFQLGNIEEHLRSKSHVIQLLALVKARSVKEHGLSAVLAPFIYDIKILEETGIHITRPEGIFHFRGSVITCISDNLGSHMLGCFSKSFNSLRSCRFCNITKPDLRVSRDISQFERRTVDQYNQQAALVTADATLSAVYGITGCSPLNELNYYHVVSGLPPDVMHDIFSSGVGVDALDAIFSHYKAEGVLTDENICERFQKFNYKGNDKSSKPDVPIYNMAMSLNQKAAQVWCIIRLCPLLLGSAIPRNDRVWEVMIALKEMVDILMSSQLSQAGITYLGDLVSYFHEVLATNFADKHLKPKGHHTLHYKELIREFGMLRNIWAMRFEAKHSYFIDIVRRTKNKKNLCKTMAKRHQYFQLSYLETDLYLDSGKYELTRETSVPVASLRDIHGLGDLVRDLTHVRMGKALAINGFVYNDECVVLSRFENDSMQFSHVRGCFVVAGIPLLHVQPLKTVQFDRHYQVYLLENCDNGATVINIKDIPDPHPLPLYKLHGRLATVMHHYVEFD